MENQRHTPRIPFHEDIRIRQPRDLTARGVDIGAGGIGVVMPEALPVGTQVEVEIFAGHATAYGEIRWSAPVEDGYRTGIQFRQEDWSIIELVETLRSQED